MYLFGASCDTNSHPKSDWCLPASLHLGWVRQLSIIRNVLVLRFAQREQWHQWLQLPSIFHKGRCRHRLRSHHQSCWALLLGLQKVSEEFFYINPSANFLIEQTFFKVLWLATIYNSNVVRDWIDSFCSSWQQVGPSMHWWKWRCGVRQNGGPWWGVKVYVYINIYIYIYIILFSFTYIHTSTHPHIHTLTHIHTYIHAYIHTYIHTYIRDMTWEWRWRTPAPRRRGLGQLPVPNAPFVWAALSTLHSPERAEERKVDGKNGRIWSVQRCSCEKLKYFLNKT